MLGPLELLMIAFAVIAIFVAVVGIPIVKALRPFVIQALKSWREKQAAKTEIATLPPAGRVFNQQWETTDAPPYRPEPMRSSFDPPKQGGGVRFNLGKIAVIVVCVAYIVFPLDFIPDFIPILGYGDDFIAGLVALKQLVK